MTDAAKTEAKNAGPARPAEGGCMCGAVRFAISDLPAVFGACHCEMCRRWAGSALLAVSVPAGAITFQDDAPIARIQSSDWAERAWCARCGSGIWYRVTAPGAMHGTYEIPVGLLDDANGLRMEREIFIDQKPDAFAFAGSREVLTRAQTLALYGATE